MHRRHYEISWVSQQNRVAIRGTNRNRHSSLRSHQSVALARHSSAASLPHHSRMNLLQTGHVFLRHNVRARAESMIDPRKFGEQGRAQHLR